MPNVSDPAAGTQAAAQLQADADAAAKNAKPTDPSRATDPADPAAPAGAAGKPRGGQSTAAGLAAAMAAAGGGKKATPQVAWSNPSNTSAPSTQQTDGAKGASSQAPTVGKTAAAAAGQSVVVPQTPTQGALHRAIYGSSSAATDGSTPAQLVGSRPAKAGADAATGTGAADALMQGQGQAFQGAIPTDAADAAGRADRPALADQIVQTVAVNNLHGTRHITIQLTPPELGRVRLTLEADGDHVRGVLEVQNPRALAELKQGTDNLAQRLAESGVDLKRLDVQLVPPGREGSMGSSLTHNSDGGQGAQSGHGGQAGQQWAGRDGTNHGGAWQSGNSNSPGSYGLGAQRNGTGDLPTEVADESINVWM
jgi:flagellar hook-length control protein FliK